MRMLKDYPGPDLEIMYSKDAILKSLGSQKSILVEVRYHLDHCIVRFWNHLFDETGILICLFSNLNIFGNLKLSSKSVQISNESYIRS